MTNGTRIYEKKGARSRYDFNFSARARVPLSLYLFLAGNTLAPNFVWQSTSRTHSILNSTKELAAHFFDSWYIFIGVSVLVSLWNETPEPVVFYAAHRLYCTHPVFIHGGMLILFA